MGPEEVRAIFSFGHEDYPDTYATGVDAYQAIYEGIARVLHAHIKLMRRSHKTTWGSASEMNFEPFDAEILR
jgi:hypothetical protein